jgi:hypothetical protein
VLVQSAFGRLVAPLCAELCSWQAEPRRRGATLLRAALVFVEDHATQHLGALLAGLCQVSMPKRGGLLGNCDEPKCSLVRVKAVSAGERCFALLSVTSQCEKLGERRFWTQVAAHVDGDMRAI